MKHCIFCSAELVGKLKSKEHVLRKSWLHDLGLATARVPATLLRGGDVVATRDHQAEQLLAGEICRACNNGWMQLLDASVSVQLIGMARGELRPAELDRLARLRFARWILKTACVFESIQPLARRHTPSAMRYALMLDGFLPPDGFVMVAHQFNADVEPRVGICLLDVWPAGRHSPELEALPQSARLKFSVQYQRIVLSCICISQARIVACEAPFGGEVVTGSVPVFWREAAITEEELAVTIGNHPSMYFCSNLSAWLN
jgi:hypothetical protein